MHKRKHDRALHLKDEARCRELNEVTVAELLNLHARTDADIVLPRAIEERRQIINLDRADVDVLAGMHIKSAAERQGKGSIGLLPVSERVVKTHAHMRDTGHTFNERRDRTAAPVISRADH